MAKNNDLIDKVTFYFDIVAPHVLESISEKNKIFSINEIARASLRANLLAMDNNQIYVLGDSIAYFDKGLGKNILELNYYKSNTFLERFLNF